VYFERSHPTPPHPTPPHPNRRTLRHYARGEEILVLLFWKCSHVPIKKESRVCVEVPVLMSSPGSSCTQGGGVLPEVFAHRRQVAGRPLGVPVLMCSPDVRFGRLSGGPPLGEPSCTGTSPTMSWFLFAQNLRAAS
jgi:hypothetical protein